MWSLFIEEPFMAEPFTAEPFMAEPFIAELFIDEPFMAEPFIAEPFIAELFIDELFIEELCIAPGAGEAAVWAMAGATVSNAEARIAARKRTCDSLLYRLGTLHPIRRTPAHG